MNEGDRVYIGIGAPECRLTSGRLVKPTTIVTFNYGDGDYSSSHQPAWVVSTSRGEVSVPEIHLTIIAE